MNHVVLSLEALRQLSHGTEVLFQPSFFGKEPAAPARICTSMSSCILFQRTKELTDTMYDYNSSRRRRVELVSEKSIVGAGVPAPLNSAENCGASAVAVHVKVVNVPVVAQRQIPMVQTVQKAMEIFQLQVMDKVVVVPVVLVVQVPQVYVVEETVEIPQLQFVEKIVVIPEVLTVQDKWSREQSTEGRKEMDEGGRPTKVPHVHCDMLAIVVTTLWQQEYQ